ncbi:hypothetical protein BKA67DRAFT_645891 [Truncatella angustata]|uniref:Uncharacterized protein n=1 Tax=Truncatella angustata TaxID=152316 RepID=A0A9P8ULD9_9PEZI|nr:uncharacterized protein BKA67DRAFT_645891 [Truncatella angustata]KAH6654120.1 hypothetical protein BKA67DRAFT_645891 [Truncatella angustata]
MPSWTDVATNDLLTAVIMHGQLSTTASQAPFGTVHNFSAVFTYMQNRGHTYTYNSMSSHWSRTARRLTLVRAQNPGIVPAGAAAPLALALVAGLPAPNISGNVLPIPAPAPAAALFVASATAPVSTSQVQPAAVPTTNPDASQSAQSGDDNDEDGFDTHSSDKSAMLIPEFHMSWLIPLSFNRRDADRGLGNLL